MRAGILTPWISYSGGGVAIAVNGLVRSLARSPEVELGIFSLADQNSDGGSDSDSYSVRQCPVAGPRALGYSPSLLPAIRAYNPDFLHVHGLWMYHSWAALSFIDEHAKPNVISPHGMLDPWALQRSRWKKRLVSALYEGRHLRRARCLHALCEPELQAIRACGLTNPVCVIPNGVTLPEARRFRAPWPGIPEGKKVCLFLGRLHEKKGVDLLVQAWSRLSAKQREEWQLVIAGWGDAKFQLTLQELADSAVDITFTGPLFDDQKQAALQHASAFVLPSFSEGLPLAVLEAWSHSVPVIMTAACNLPIGFKSEAALEIEPDLKGIHQGLTLMLSSSDSDRDLMGRNGRGLVCKHYTWDGVANQFKDVYRWLVDGTSRPNCIAA